jgi:futalosine hydrolase
MYLIASPTELEISQLKENEKLAKNFNFLITGVGVVESVISLARFLSEESLSKKRVDCVILFGVCGAYADTEVDILDICLAEEEHFGDFGVATESEIQYFTEDILKNKLDFNLKSSLFDKIKINLTALEIPYKSGHFVTVNSCSGTLTRGNFLRDRFGAICENMEGAAVARVCETYRVPIVELRCVSNMVEDRDESKWKIKEAVAKGNEALAKLLVEVIK